MNFFSWKDRTHAELVKFEITSKFEISTKIIGFPNFTCYPSSRMSKRNAKCRSTYLACAHTQKIKSNGRIENSGDIWFIEFNDLISDFIDMDLLLYHELAHFMSHSICCRDPDHGLLWAACVDALNIIMEIDSESLAEGTEYIFLVDEAERISTFEFDSISSEMNWREKREADVFKIYDLLSRLELPIHYLDLMDLILISTGRGRLASENFTDLYRYA